jgi:hypothetical protein
MTGPPMRMANPRIRFAAPVTQPSLRFFESLCKAAGDKAASDSSPRAEKSVG